MQIDVRLGNNHDELDASRLVSVAFDHDSLESSKLSQVIHTGLRSIIGAVVVEDWFSSVPVVRGCDASFHYAHNGKICFGWLYFGKDDPLEEATQSIYADVFRVLKGLGFAHLLRAWHYFPNIHAQEGGVSRYKRFCQGRFEVFKAIKQQNYCAATVIGTQSSFGVMYFLAAREPGMAMENPRQTSAWQYPLPAVQERPQFVRATCKAWGKKMHFYGSGTAGIVGHESLHKGDTVAQLQESLFNLRILLDQSPNFAGVKHLTYMKVYIARADDADIVRDVLDTSGFMCDAVALLEGDICRKELCVEIEALIV